MNLDRSLRRLLLLLSVLVAAALRLYRLQDLPPGIFIDEAFYAWDATRVLRTGYLTIFFPANNGREPLFIYLQAAAMAALGVQEWVLRVVPALAGIATIPAIYMLARTLFTDDRRAQVIGLAAAATAAVLYWHVNFSRVGFRAILLPLASTLAVYFIARGWHSARRTDFVFGGIWLGLTLYTYLSARLLPLILLTYLVALAALDLWANRHSTTGHMAPPVRSTLGGSALAFATAIVVAAPLFSYFYLHPTDFLGRADEVTLTAKNISSSGAAKGTTPEQVLLANAIKVGRIFVDRGDANPRHNLPGRPALDPLMALGFFVALGVGLVTWWKQPAYLLLMIWLAAMLMPSVLSTEAPHFLRTIGAIPPLVVLVADGLTRLWDRLVPRLSPALLVAVILVLSGALTFHDYFQVWANDPRVYKDAFDVVAAPLSARIRELSDRADLLVPLRLYGGPTLNLLLQPDFPREKSYASETRPERPLFIVSSGGTTDSEWVLLTRDGQGKGEVLFPDVIPDLAARFRQGPSSQPIIGARGVRVGGVIPMRDDARTALHPPQPASGADFNFGNVIRLVGYTQDTVRASPGTTVQLTLYWEPLVNIDRGYNVFVHLLAPDSTVRGQVDSTPVNNGYSTSLWPAGIVVPDVYYVTLPKDAPPGEYRVEIGWVSAPGERLPILDASGRQLDDKFMFGPLQVGGAPSAGAIQVAGRSTQP